MDEAGRAGSNNRDSRKSFYTVSEAAKVLGVGQRRILEMLETEKLEGERDPISSRWKIAKHVIDELAPEEATETKEPLLSEEPPVTEEDTMELPTAEETQSTEETTQLERQAGNATWQEKKESLLATADRERRRAEGLQEEVDRLTAELATVRERIGELKSLNEHVRLEQQAEQAAWKEEKGALLAAANRELQHAEELQKEVARLRAELEETWGLTGKLEKVNERLKLEQQTEKTAWQEEKRSLLAEGHRDREHAEELREEVERLNAELEVERSKGFWRRLSGG